MNNSILMVHPFFFIIAYFFLIGILVGILSVLFGVGGGLVIVPAISIFLEYFGYAHNLAMKTAVATSLLTILFSTLNVLRHQHKNGYVPWHLLQKFLPAVMLGSLTGAVLASKVPGIWLTYLFIIFLVYVIVRALWDKNFKTAYRMEDFIEPSQLNKNIVGLIVGMLSALIGVGGNIFLIPYLRYYRFPMKNAAALTVGLVPFLAFIGSIGYFIEGIGLDEKIMPPYSVGYVNLPAFVFILMGSFFGAIGGEKLLGRIYDTLQAKAYLIFLLIILVGMLLSLS